MRPLEGLRVVDLAGGCAGPGAAMYLADYGAEVIKIELPEGDPERLAPPLLNGVGQAFLAFNRGKKSICLDWRKPGGHQRGRELVDAADVVIVDLTSEPAFPCGDLRAANPGLIYAAV